MSLSPGSSVNRCEINCCSRIFTTIDRSAFSRLPPDWHAPRERRVPLAGRGCSVPPQHAGMRVHSSAHHLWPAGGGPHLRPAARTMALATGLAAAGTRWAAVYDFVCGAAVPAGAGRGSGQQCAALWIRRRYGKGDCWPAEAIDSSARWRAMVYEVETPAVYACKLSPEACSWPVITPPRCCDLIDADAGKLLRRPDRRWRWRCVRALRASRLSPRLSTRCRLGRVQKAQSTRDRKSRATAAETTGTGKRKKKDTLLSGIPQSLRRAVKILTRMPRIPLRRDSPPMCSPHQRHRHPILTQHPRGDGNSA